MTVSRVGTQQSQSFVMQQINYSLSRYVSTQEQVTTGQKSQRFSGIADDASNSINLANSKVMIEQYNRSSDTTNSRLSAASNVLENLVDIASKFRAQLLQGLTADQAALARLDRVADGNLEQIESGLNTDLAGVYIFAGTKSDQQPVDLSDSSNNILGLYYSGGKDLLETRIDETTTLQYGATADRQGFKDLIEAMQRVSNGVNDQTQLETALDKVNSALNDLTQLQAELGHQMSVVEGAKTRNEALRATVVEQLGSIRDVDISAAMVELTQRQTILQASYLVISRSSQLTLTNYL